MSRSGSERPRFWTFSRSPLNYIEKMHPQVLSLMENVKVVSDRLRIDVGRREKTAHKRAYRELANSVRDFLKKVPAPPEESAIIQTGKERPPKRGEEEEAIIIKREIPFRVSGQKVFMGCFKCEDWIDVTRVFGSGLLDGTAHCGANPDHVIVFAGLPQPPSEKEKEKGKGRSKI